MPYNNKGQIVGTGKRYHKYTYTIQDIMRITGLKRSTIYKYVQLGKVNLYDLESVSRFIGGYTMVSE